MVAPMPADLSASARRAYSLNPRQFMDALLSTLPDGQRIVHVHNSSGLTFTLLPDRGLDIWSAHFQGLPLTWLSMGAPHRADYGSGWLRLFNGGLLTTCGFSHVGPPEQDDLTGEQRDIHGHATRLPAQSLAILLDDDTLMIRAELVESRLFGEQIHVQRTYRLTLGKPAITLTDSVTNRGDQPTPFMLLYHVNVGYPLVREGSRLVIDSEVSARDEAAAAGLATWAHYNAPTPNYAEQVFFHRVRGQTHAQAALINDDLGLRLTWDTTHAPHFTQWKNTRQGIYVCGLEPGNCIPEGQNSARRHGRLVTLAPNEQQHFHVQLSVTRDAHTLAQWAQR